MAGRVRGWLVQAGLVKEDALAPEVVEERKRIDILGHLTWIMPTAAVILVMVEVYGVADFNVATSLAIMSSAGPTEVAAGAVLALLPFILPIVAMAATWWALRLRAVGANADHPVLAWAVAAAAILLSAWQHILLVVGIAIVYVAAFAVAAWLLGRAHGKHEARFRAGPMVIVAGLAVFLMTLTEPWVAPEVIWVRNTPEVRAALEPSDGFVVTDVGLASVAYPLDDGLTWDTFLVRKTRRVIRIRTEDMIARNTCRYALPHQRESLLHQILGHSDKSPNDECPTSAEIAGGDYK